MSYRCSRWTGARVLVTTAAGTPYANVESLKLHRVNANTNREILDTVDVSRDLAPVTVNPAAPCPSFTYHREYGTVSNPIQLLPGSYRVVAQVRSASTGKMEQRTVGFDVQTCDFNPTITIVIP